jgi:hypothetical protein
VWPPPKENYVWEALQGAVVQAQLLSRTAIGYGLAWQWEEQALLRAVRWLHDVCKYPASGDDRWIPWLVNRAYGTSFPAGVGSVGKNMGFTDWTHAGAATNPPPPPPPNPDPEPLPPPPPPPPPDPVPLTLEERVTLLEQRVTALEAR